MTSLEGIDVGHFYLTNYVVYILALKKKKEALKIKEEVFHQSKNNIVIALPANNVSP